MYDYLYIGLECRYCTAIVDIARETTSVSLTKEQAENFCSQKAMQAIADKISANEGHAAKVVDDRGSLAVQWEENDTVSGSIKRAVFKIPSQKLMNIYKVNGSGTIPSVAAMQWA